MICNGTLPFLEQAKQRIEKRLGELIELQQLRGVPFFASLFEGASYVLQGGGKRIRPLLALATFESFSGNLEEGLDPACALELIHTYSLIHDDLPSMDNDDFRRGRPTLHKVTNEGHAILVGDFLLTYAFEVIAKSPFTSSIKLGLIQILSEASGGLGMVGGQMMDLSMTGKNLNIEDLEILHLHKTGALIKASILFGAIMGNASDQEKTLLSSFGEKLGLLFQIVDDILDITAPKQKHGKNTSTDALLGKTTYVSLLGLPKAKECAFSLYEDLSSILMSIPKETSLLQGIAQKIIEQID